MMFESRYLTGKGDHRDRDKAMKMAAEDVTTQMNDIVNKEFEGMARIISVCHVQISYRGTNNFTEAVEAIYFVTFEHE